MEALAFRSAKQASSRLCHPERSEGSALCPSVAEALDGSAMSNRSQSESSWAQSAAADEVEGPRGCRRNERRSQAPQRRLVWRGRPSSAWSVLNLLGNGWRRYLLTRSLTGGELHTRVAPYPLQALGPFDPRSVFIRRSVALVADRARSARAPAGPRPHCCHRRQGPLSYPRSHKMR